MTETSEETRRRSTLFTQARHLIELIGIRNANRSVEDQVEGPKNVTVANTEVLDKSDISLSVKQACALGLNDKLSAPTVPSMLVKREHGKSFTSGQKAKIVHNYLPNHPFKIDSYSIKPFCGTFSQDGKFFLTTIHDRLVHLYDYDDGNYKLYKTFYVSAVGWSILDTAFSPDGNHFVYSSWSDYLYLHSIHGDPTHREPLLLNEESQMFCVFSVVFSCDGRELICGGNDGCIYIYDRGSQNCSRVPAHICDINSVAFADESSHILYSAGDDGLCKVWDRRTLREDDPKPVGVLVGHMGGITHIDPRGDGRHLITNSKDQTIKLWDARVFARKEFQERAEYIIVTSNTWDYRWQNVPRKFLHPRIPLKGDTSLMTYRGHVVIQTLIRCHFSPAATTGQRYIYTGCGSGSVIIYDLLTGKIVKTLKTKNHDRVVRDVSWHPYNQEIVSTSWDGEVVCWKYYNPEDDTCSSDDPPNIDDSNRRRTRSSTLQCSNRLTEFRNSRVNT